MDLEEGIAMLAEIARKSKNNREKIAALDRLAKLRGWFEKRAKSEEDEDEELLPGLKQLSEEDIRKLAGEDSDVG